VFKLYKRRCLLRALVDSVYDLFYLCVLFGFVLSSPQFESFHLNRYSMEIERIAFNSDVDFPKGFQNAVANY
jgi:hypothetical protein